MSLCSDPVLLSIDKVFDESRSRPEILLKYIQPSPDNVYLLRCINVRSVLIQKFLPDAKYADTPSGVCRMPTVLFLLIYGYTTLYHFHYHVDLCCISLVLFSSSCE